MVPLDGALYHLDGIKNLKGTQNLQILLNPNNQIFVDY